MTSDPVQTDPLALLVGPAADYVGAVDRALEEQLSQVALILDRVAGADAGPDALPEGGAGDDLRVDVVEELGTRLRHHGKRLRPLFARCGWEVAGGDEDTFPELVDVAAALELLQLFALAQDDVMDRSAERRGRPTLHVEAARRHRAAGGLGDPVLFGDSVAVLVADLALSEATLLAASVGGAVTETWRVMATELVEGQLLDITHTASRRRDVATSRRMARLKSGRYTITRPLQLGAAVAGADAEQLEALGRWGDLVGDVFALRDDVLGVWGDPARTGKPAGEDLSCGKATVLLVWAREMVPAHEHHLLDACDAGELDEVGVRRLRRAMEDAGVRERAEAQVTELVARAADDLTDLCGPDGTHATLRSALDLVAWRTR
ncbi:polyprenyl synthetase family protein [Lapillicoccus jejuensis]|uniref:Geranylgeranyl diphosphate synthase type I n=1 Tax=Lapillicoccus jejuensis TaxID=402171 RepID=A0A542DY65_9MICO|nr:polyprenyl synthetase family protein [Lapillicoccus jejuensis]TQJ08043.1 geranylgeranyl diphosphate synthase type I [Lapillicoccus jejuensis]